jgi:acylphosphatase
MNREAKRIIVHGIVQGVGFRYFVQRAGTRMGLTGDVRNLPDRTVEIIVEGDSGRMDVFLKEVRKGPPASQVDRLEIHEIAPGGGYKSFMMEGW